MAKLIVIIFISIILVFFLALLSYIIYAKLGGVGDWQYPLMSKEGLMEISFNSLQSNMLILPLWKYVLMGFFLLIPMVIFTVMLVFYISIATDSNNKTIGIGIVLIFLAFVLGSFLPKESIVNLWYPYCYLYLDKVLTVSSRGNYFIGILMSIIGSIILFVLSYSKFSRKDFLGAVG